MISTNLSNTYSGPPITTTCATYVYYYYYIIIIIMHIYAYLHCDSAVKITLLFFDKGLVFRSEELGRVVVDVQ